MCGLCGQKTHNDAINLARYQNFSMDIGPYSNQKLNKDRGRCEFTTPLK